MTINDLKRLIVNTAFTAKEGHIPSAFSVLDILYVLYNDVLGPEDQFILSKGHASLALYVVLGLYMGDFCKYDSLLGGHPDRCKVPGVIASGGSLGHCVGQAVGLALAYKINGYNRRVFALVGDGECEEGSVWEALNLVDRYQLSNLTVIVDLNHSNASYDGLKNPLDKFKSFGFLPIKVNGHDHDDIRYALKYKREDQPIAILAETVKGKGVARMENSQEWHHKIPNEIELAEILEELSAANS